MHRYFALLALAACGGTASSRDMVAPVAGHTGTAAHSSSTPPPASTAVRVAASDVAGTGASSAAGGKPSPAPGGSGGEAVSGGRAGSMPSASSAGAALPDVYVCQASLAAHPPDPSGQATEGAPCCNGRGSCQRRSSIELGPALGHDSCNAELACAPTASAQPTACHAQTGEASLEGRCLPRCFLLATPAALLLATSDCGDDEVCGACFDPVTARETGACALIPGDKPKEPAPAPFKPCGLYQDKGPSAGVCMPKVLAKASKSSVVDLLPQDTCSGSEVCMPNLKAADYTACFAACETSALVQAAGSKEGGCIPPYIAAFSNPEAVGFLEQGKCAAGELCAPCLDPTKNMSVSGACN